ncbi:MFS transporter [Candidatus Hakubella thermalkaliphila]|uniref:Major facilitator superfamily (MFS) profile domain-containing protein n=1 Tax=Candidatus Hakubella thermalkaliphila TaxID=2754717 RepID=A0A6V8QEP9_9ACTN|nr:MFS transporter [Candidatus Hakubella thermalkaliphila]GFP26748.1 hypothetical protein HKBW3S33_00163 [Candidatus Hakubella thermalkaliphila]GFP41816.1 hypothetical protein HKBW3C_00943 [Candidatus Hakubella thermalkaliphila]
MEKDKQGKKNPYDPVSEIAAQGPLPGIKKNVFVLGVVSFLQDVSSEMIYPLLPLFLAQVLGVSKAYIGLIEGTAETTASLMKIASGWLSDRLRKRKALVFWGYFLSTIAKPFLALTTAGWQVLGLRFMDRLGKGVRTSPRDALIADSTPAATRGKSFGFHRAMDTLGAVFGPLIAFVLLPLFNHNYRPIFLLALIPTSLALLMIIFFVAEKRAVASGDVSLPKLSLRSFDRKFKMLLLVIILFTLGNSSDAFLILRAQNVGVATVLIPIVWFMFNTVYSSVAFLGGALSDWIGRKRVVIMGFLVYSLVYLGFAFAFRPLHIWTLFAVYGIYYGLTDGVLRAFVVDLVPAGLRGTALGLYHTSVGLTALPASLIMGLLWESMGPTIAFSFGAALALIATMLLLVPSKQASK